MSEIHQEAKIKKRISLTYKFEFLGFDFEEWHLAHDYARYGNPKKHEINNTTKNDSVSAKSLGSKQKKKKKKTGAKESTRSSSTSQLNWTRLLQNEKKKLKKKNSSP